MAVVHRPKEVSEELLLRIRSEYGEMPGLHLTVAQAARLWALDCTTCSAALERLVETNYLRRTPEGAYALTHSGLMACAWPRKE